MSLKDILTFFKSQGLRLTGDRALGLLISDITTFCPQGDQCAI